MILCGVLIPISEEYRLLMFISIPFTIYNVFVFFVIFIDPRESVPYEILNPIISDNLYRFKFILSKGYTMHKLENSIIKSETILNLAISNKSYQIITYLIDNGYNLTTSYDSNTALHKAISVGDEIIVKLLLQKEPKNLNSNDMSVIYNILPIY